MKSLPAQWFLRHPALTCISNSNAIFGWSRGFALTAATLLLAFAQPAHAQLSKGNSILVDRGLQVMGLVQPDDGFNLNTFSNANYSALIWAWAYSEPASWNLMSRLGAAPGFPWARWAGDESAVPPLGGEAPYMSQLQMVQLGDEWFLDDEVIRDRAVNWFDSIREDFPNTILYMNNYGGQVNDANLFDFAARAQPDMLCFDTYPFRSVYDENEPNSTGPAIGGPPTTWYSELRRYRDIARPFSIPFGSYNQVFAAVETWDGGRVYRHPSPSELRVNMFAALAFNAKVLIDYTYNSGASSLFDRTPEGHWTGDGLPNALYAEKTDANLRARNLGKALVRLKPIDEATGSWTTSVMFNRGQNSAGDLNAIPINFYAGPSTANPYTDWVSGRNDPYLVNWTVTNTGNRNNGYPGDVIVSWFKPLDESFDGPDHSDQVYMMVVNGLTDPEPSSTAADCAQQIKLNFANTFKAVEIINPLTGNVEVQELPVVNNRRQLTLNLNGGDAALFKFATGAPFVGANVVGAPVILQDPASRTNLAGTDATFSILAAGASPMSFQWRFNGVNISGATTTSYTRVNVQSADAGNYTVAVTNDSGSVTSIIAKLTVQAPPQIITEPQSQTVSAGADVSFNVVTSGSPTPAYQWRYNGANIPGATGSSYTLLNVQSSDTGDYSVFLSNVVGSVPSADATLTVNGPPSITSQPKEGGVLLGQDTSFSVTAVGTGSLTYQWRKDNFDLSDDSTFSGTTSSVLTIANVQNSELGTYTVQVGNTFGNVISAPAALVIATQPVIEQQPESRTENAGTTVTFNVVASGGGLGYQWRRAGSNIFDNENIAGTTTDTVTLSTILRSDAGSYTVVVTNAAGTVTSAAATLTVVYPLPWRDSFNYSTGENIGGKLSPNFLPWADVGTGVTGPFITVVPGNLAIDGLQASFGNSIQFGSPGKSARLSFPTGTPFNSGTVYKSFALKVADLTGATAGGGFIAGFNNSVGTQAGEPTVVATRVNLRAVTGGFNIGLAKSSSTGADWVWDSRVFTTSDTIFIVGSYTFTTVGNTTDDIAKMWINPDPADFATLNPPSPSLTATAGNDINANQIASYVFFRRSAGNIPAVMFADDLRIGTTWASVTPTLAPLRMESVAVLENGDFLLNGSGDPGNYVMEASADLINWTDLNSQFSTDGTFEFTDPASNLQQYYRVRLE
ncbi:MAG: immunoglobulin domain-containing protein [Verrucomicrobia bacterium]|nr:immunoglobulin domain-containing protein [Verrucomicrobiota bacterium]